MFRLNDAVRRYQAQHPPQPESQHVTASVATLSPRARPETTRVFATVATVAAVATPPLELTNLALLIEQLREEGAPATPRERPPDAPDTLAAGGQAQPSLESLAALSTNKRKR